MYFAYFIIIALIFWICIGIYLLVDTIFLQPKNDKKSLEILQSQLDNIQKPHLLTKPKFLSPTVVPFVAHLFYVR